MTSIRWHRIVTEPVPPTLQFLIEAGVDVGEARATKALTCFARSHGPLHRAANVRICTTVRRDRVTSTPTTRGFRERRRLANHLGAGRVDPVGVTDSLSSTRVIWTR